MNTTTKKFQKAIKMSKRKTTISTKIPLKLKKKRPFVLILVTLMFCVIMEEVSVLFLVLVVDLVILVNCEYIHQVACVYYHYFPGLAREINETFINFSAVFSAVQNTIWRVLNVREKNAKSHISKKCTLDVKNSTFTQI